MSIVGFYGHATEADAFETLGRALDLGVNFWDTANVYGEGVSESLIGRFFREDRARRDRIVLATKFGIRRHPDGRRTIDNDPNYLVECLEASLARLGVDRVDLYYVHRLDPRIPVEDTVGALAREVGKGKIGAIGLSEVSPDTLRRAHAVHEIAAVQSEYSLWTRSPELGLIQTCRELGASFVAFSPVGRGVFGGAVRDVEALPAEDFRRGTPRFTGLNWTRNLATIDRFLALAAEWGVNPAALAIAWTLAKGDHIIPIPGTRYAGHVAQNSAAVDIALDPERIAAIERALPVGFAAGDRYAAQQWGAAERYC
jgi:aryl-alcohol dehydrogenase-like predicted oxidoreductase